MWAVAVQWLTFYWPLVTAPEFVAQIRGESGACPKPIAFRTTINDLVAQYGQQGLWTELREIENDARKIISSLRKIAQTIEKGPVTFAGTRNAPGFQFTKAAPSAPGVKMVDGTLGWIVVPESVWLDISRFDHWIEDSVVIRWSSLTAEMNRRRTLDQFLPYLLSTPGNERDTSEIRAVLASSGRALECVWTGRTLQRGYHVDHAVPYAVWGNNDFWNLLPCHDQMNLQKSDALPAQALIRERADCIVGYWQQYRQVFSRQFDMQIIRALGCRSHLVFQHCVIFLSV